MCVIMTYLIPELHSHLASGPAIVNVTREVVVAKMLQVELGYIMPPQCK